MAVPRPLRIAALALASVAAVAGLVILLGPGSGGADIAAPKAESTSGSKPPGQAARLPVQVLVMQPQSLHTPVPATGTLLPRESVTIVSELSRRLVRVRVQEGQSVKKGTVLFELDAADLLAERNRLEVQRKLASRNAARQAELLKESVTSEAEADSARAAELEIAAAQNVIAVTLARTTIVAPFDGKVGLRQVSEGAWLTPSTPLITLADTSELRIDFRIPERHAAEIRIGAEFRVSVRGQPQTHIGRITATEPGIDPASRSLLVRGMLPSESGLLPGTFAKVELPIVLEDIIAVPTIVVIPGVSGRSVFVERDGKAHLVPVQLGARTPELVQVEQGLSVGDRVIVSNLLRLRDGAPVRVEPSPSE